MEINGENITEDILTFIIDGANAAEKSEQELSANSPHDSLGHTVVQEANVDMNGLPPDTLQPPSSGNSTHGVMENNEIEVQSNGDVNRQQERRIEGVESLFQLYSKYSNIMFSTSIAILCALLVAKSQAEKLAKSNLFIPSVALTSALVVVNVLLFVLSHFHYNFRMRVLAIQIVFGISITLLLLVLGTLVALFLK